MSSGHSAVAVRTNMGSRVVFRSFALQIYSGMKREVNRPPGRADQARVGAGAGGGGGLIV